MLFRSLADSVPPANFALSLSAVSSTTANMTFTFTGDDGTSGSPAKYELGMVQVTGTVAAGVDPCACDPNAGVSCPADKACLGSQCVALFTNPLEVRDDDGRPEERRVGKEC